MDNVDEDFSMAVTFVVDNDDYTPTIKQNKYDNGVFDKGENNNITTFSTVKYPKTASYVDYGILFSTTAGTEENLVFPYGDLSEWDGDIEDLGNDVTKYRAKAIGYDGKYAVMLKDGGSHN